MWLFRNSVAVIFVIFFSVEVIAGVSTSDPLWDWKYDAIERLTIASGEVAVLNSRPVSRIEMARTVIDLSLKLDRGQGNGYFSAMLDRLSRDLKQEIDKVRNDADDGLLFRPLQWTRFKISHADSPLKLENDYGSTGNDAALRGEISTAGSYGIAGFDLRPQFDLVMDAESDAAFTLHSGYVSVWLGNIGLRAGKDAYWWGPGRHGAWIFTDNAPAFEFIEISNAVSSVPPWPLHFMGKTRLNGFIGRTSRQSVSYKNGDADITEEREPYLMGMRIDFVPADFIELGASRAAMFINRKGESFSVNDIKQVLISDDDVNETEATEGPVADHIASIDVTLRFGADYEFMRALNISGLKLYWEYGGEDLDNKQSTLLTNPANLFGAYVDTGTADFLVEYADNLDTTAKWYEHYQFNEGFRNDGYILGHHGGGHNRNLFIQASYPFRNNVSATVHFENNKRKESGGSISLENAAGLSIEFFSANGGGVVGSYVRREGDKQPSHNNIWSLEGLYRF